MIIGLLHRNDIEALHACPVELQRAKLWVSDVDAELVRLRLTRTGDDRTKLKAC